MNSRSELSGLANVGPAALEDLQRLGVASVRRLPEALFNREGLRDGPPEATYSPIHSARCCLARME